MRDFYCQNCCIQKLYLQCLLVPDGNPGRPEWECVPSRNEDSGSLQPGGFPSKQDIVVEQIVEDKLPSNRAHTKISYLATEHTLR